MLVNVILSGGSGTRLWPLSRVNNPKQFLTIFNQKSLFQNTILRNKPLVDDYLIITNKSQYKLAKQQANQLNINLEKKVIEPIGRNTAPAIALAAMSLNADDIMLVTPSDHVTEGQNNYENAIKRAVELAQSNNLVTFGVKPTKPHTGFGYIEYNKENVLSFREKPDQKTAQQFINQGNFTWNSGMFCFKVSVFLDELKYHQPKMYSYIKKAYTTMSDVGMVDLEAMKSIPADSVDYAVLEKSKKIKVVATDFYWTDLGTFDAIIDYFENRNSVDSLNKINNNTFVFSKKQVYSEVEDLVVIDTDDTLLILNRNKTDLVKNTYDKYVKNNNQLK